MSRVFITHILPQHLISKYKLSFAACNFSYNLISGGGFDKVYSIMPLFVSGKMEAFGDPDNGLIYSRLRHYGPFRKIAPLFENFTLFSKISKNDSVWYYNCTILNAFLIVLLHLFKPSVKQNIILLDYTPCDKMIDRFFLWLSNHMHGMIKLADSPLFTVKNSVCLPGVVPDDGKEYPKVQNVKKEFLISGALGDNISMLSMLLDAFTQMPDLTLHITGKAPDAKKVEEYASKYKNIIYHGMVEYDEYLRILHTTPFLLSTRDPRYPENQCNFPSKVIEALLHNRIIISTIHYSQLDGIKYFEVGANIEDFIKDIQAISRTAGEVLIQYANQSSIVKERFNVRVWNEWMKKIEEYEN